MADDPLAQAEARERLIRVLKSSDKNSPRHVAALARALGLRPYPKRVPYESIADALMNSAALHAAREDAVRQYREALKLPSIRIVNADGREFLDRNSVLALWPRAARAANQEGR